MRFRFRAVILAALMGFPWSAFAADVAMDADRMLLVNGERTFIMGLYENPAEDAVLEDVAHAGFNLVRSSDDTASLDRLHRHRLYAWINTGGLMQLGPDSIARETQLEEMVARCGAHPALAIWEGPDEGLWMCAVNALSSEGTLKEKTTLFNKNASALRDGLLAGYEKIKELDPHHPVWLNHAAGNSVRLLEGFGRAADIVGADIYPLMPYPTHPMDISRIGLGWVGVTTSRMQESAPGKPVWMVLQGMSWGYLSGELFAIKEEPAQWPTLEESRFMAYDAVARGARGILYWGTHVLEKDSECWKGILTVVRELADNQSLLTAPDSPVAPTIDAWVMGVFPLSLNDNILSLPVLGKTLNGETWWIIVNEYFFPVTYTLNGLDTLEGVVYTDSGSGNEASVRKGALTFSIPRLGIHILRPASH
ncbi:MAG TPA: hypothetical protein PKO23_10520 [Candidatus Hydrogenedentes bacterium]|nr:hypothetical protein [Candidatus Hydrogenedentota bacterium]